MPSFSEWCARYQRESPYPLRLEGTVEFDPDRGFMNYLVFAEDGFVLMSEVCGDIKHWHTRAKEIAKSLGLAKVMGASWRNPRAITRKLGCRHVGYLFESEV